MIANDPWVISLLSVGGAMGVIAVLRRGRSQLIATVVAAVAFFGLVLAPRTGPRTDETLLLTEGASADSLVSRRSGLAPPTDVYALGEDASWPSWVERLGDAGSLARRPGLSGRLTIAGHGLDPWDVERLLVTDGLEVAVDQLPPVPEGVTRISWRRDLVVGQPLVVSGTVTGGGTLRLEGPAGRVEQIVSARVEETPFTLKLVPPGAGRFLFDLVLERPGSAERAGTLDVHVREAEPPTVLWLEGAPSFETRYTKQWLADAGGSVAVRTTVSRDRFRYEYHNLDRIDLSRLTVDRLEGFDVLVLDADLWAELAASERRSIEQAVRAGSLGLVLRLVLDGEEEPKVPFGVSFRRIADLDRLMVRPATLADPPEPIAIPPYELDGPGVPLFRDRAGRVLAVRRQLGRGVVAATALTGSYRWVLEGRPDAHRAHWIALLEATVPADDRARWMLPGGPLPLHQPLTVTLAGEPADTVELIEPDGRRATVPMRQHPRRLDRFSTTLWPRRAGWHRLETDDSVALFHVAERSDWRAWRLTRRRDVTALAASRGVSPVGTVDTRTSWLRLLALATLLVALSWAWLDERRTGS